MSTKKPTLVSQRFEGIFINPDGHKNMTFRYIVALYEETYSDGSTELVHGKPVYDHEAHPVIQPIFSVACEVWRVLQAVLNAKEGA